MTLSDCPREPDVFEAAGCGRWPDDLRAHADACPVCADLVVVAAALHREMDEATHEAHVPTSGQVWWRAAMRRRTEAAAVAARPITLAQGVAGACAAGALAALMTMTWGSVQQLFASIPETVSLQGERIGEMARTVTMHQELLTAVAVVGAGLVLMPFVLYAVFSED